MTKKRSTKRALLMSALSLLLCISMLIGSTYAWFTDEVTSSGNIIKSGTLKVAMEWKEATADDLTYKNAAEGAIFDNDLWEPGYVEAKNIRITNKGTLALKYQLRILANGVVSELADVIDVYYAEGELTPGRALTGLTKLGTLSEVLVGISTTKPAAGDLLKGEADTVTIALKMQESAGNQYQDLAIGADFSIQLLATQLASEKDSFDNTYDANADFDPQDPPKATVYALSQAELAGITAGTTGATLDVGYSFQPTETKEQGAASKYADAHADFFVYADATVPANSIALAGYYNAFNGFSLGGQTLSPTNWIALTSSENIAAGAENGVRLVNGFANVSYKDVCNYGNDGTGFLCGVAGLSDAVAGTTITVELRLYETRPYGHEAHTLADGTTCNGVTANCETGEYIVVGTTTYTFPAKEVSSTEDLADAISTGVKSVTVAEDMTLTGTVLSGTSDLKVNLAADTTVTVASGAATNKDLTFTGDKSSTVVFVNTNPGYEGKLAYHDGANLTFKGITFDASEISGICARPGVITFEDCFITGELEQTIATKFVFKGCTFDAGVTQVGYGCPDVVFEDCKFETNGYGIKIYSDGANDINLTVKNSSFKNTGDAKETAIFLDHIGVSINYNITIEGCTFEGYTNAPVSRYNKWADRAIVTDSIIQKDGQYVFAYQTGVADGNYYHPLTGEQLTVTVK